MLKPAGGLASGSTNGAAALVATRSGPSDANTALPATADTTATTRPPASGTGMVDGLVTPSVAGGTSTLGVLRQPDELGYDYSGVEHSEQGRE